MTEVWRQKLDRRSDRACPGAWGERHETGGQLHRGAWGRVCLRTMCPDGAVHRRGQGAQHA